MFEKKLSELAALQKKTAAYQHALSLLSFDGNTAAPKGTAANRGQSAAILTEEVYKLSTGKEAVELLEELDAQKEKLSPEIARQVFLMLREIRFMQKIPQEEYVEFERFTVQSEDVWHTAKEKSDFESFAPYLEKIFETVKRFAQYAEPEKDPYDFWLNRYEEGLNQQICDDFFRQMRRSIVPLVQETAPYSRSIPNCFQGHFPLDKQEQLSLYLMSVMQLPEDHCALSTTEHPFTTSLGSHYDVRITTHYYPEDAASSMYSVIHEGGHALYDLGSRDAYAYTVLDGGVSCGIHESQSRFYENILGRSRSFIHFIAPKLRTLFPEQLKNYSNDDLWRSVNKVQPSLIRTDADEVTYALHVLIRYELEKSVLAGELAVRDLPHEWNRLYKEILGVEVPDDKNGILQDSHWSFGAIGYFPSYALGSAYGAQMYAKMNETVKVEDCLLKGDFSPINQWNKDHIWQYGCLLTPGEVLQNALEAPFDPQYYIDYLQKKCADVYQTLK